MSPTTQQRLIGSILLLCVLSGVAFFLINSARDEIPEVADTPLDIPFVSSIDAITDSDEVEIVEAPQEALIDAQAPLIDTHPEITLQPVSETASIQKIADSISDDGIQTPPEAEKITSTMWSLQLASLADRDSANALSKKVALLGYKASVEKAETPKGDRFRVRIGPKKDKLALEAISKVLEGKLNLKPLMLKQLPNESPNKS